MTKIETIRFSVAPMMDWTDKHCRSFHRLLSRRARLYTEMVTTGALIHGPRARLLDYNAQEHPVALQLGGSNPADLAFCAKLAEDLGYDEVNLNCGCPSDRVQNGAFGACLMAEPALVGDCVAAMKAKVKIPVTLKCRIGIDEQDPEIALRAFVDTSQQAGVDFLIIHARKAWLKGLSPKENRDIPPLDYDLVHRIKAEYPQIPIILNGGLIDLAQSLPHLALLDGVMLGRSAYHNPELLLDVDRLFYGEAAPHADVFSALEAYEPYIAAELAKDVRLHDITRHLLGLFVGRPGARAFRRHLAIEAPKRGAGLDVLRDAVAQVKSAGEWMASGTTAAA
jgi:tRNA-dihydrouridine synthase A